MSNYYQVKNEDGTSDERVEYMLQQTVEDPGMPVIWKLLAGNYSISKDPRIRLGTLLAVREYRVL